MSYFTHFNSKATALLFALATLLATPAITYGQIYVSFPGTSGSANGVINNYTTAGVLSSTLTSSLNGPEGLALWGTDLYVAVNFSSGAAQIEKFTAGGGSPAVFSSSTGAGSTIGLGFGSTGILYAANPGNTAIVQFAAGGNGTPLTFTSGATSDTYGLAVDSASNVYAAGYLSNTNIISYNSSGGVRWSVAGTGTSQRGLAVNGDGTILYVANANGNTINTYDTITGTSLGIFATASDGLSNPRGLAFSGGTLFVVNQTGGATTATIEMFTAAHTGTSFTVGGYPEYIAVGAIPEPSTYAAIAGAAMLGFAVWRRRKSVSAKLTV
jgi:hypothetical protein